MKKTLLYLLTAVTLISFNACDKDDDEKPTIYGDWTTTITQPDGKVYKEDLTHNEDGTYEAVITNEYMPNIWVAAGGTKGTFTYTDTKITYQVTALGSTSYNETTHVVTLIWNEKGTDEYTNSIEQWGGEIITIDYVLSGNELIRTYNGQSTTYTRVE